MLIKVDWISFSIPVEPVANGDELEALKNAAQSLYALHKDFPDWLGLTGGVEAGNGRAPYRTSWRGEYGGVVAFTHPVLSHALIEISGAGCDALSERGVLREVLQASQSRITRLDVACDILTDQRPPAFATRRNTQRFKAHSHVVSESGETYYVGARSSARYARVYRWNPPHERSNFLRVEMVVKAEDAKRTVLALLSTGLEATAKALGDAFGWDDPLWQINATQAELEAYRPDRKEGKTLYWLADTVAPLLARLHKEGIIDVVGWVEEHVFPKIED